MDSIEREMRADRFFLLVGLFRGVPTLDEAEAARDAADLTDWGMFVAQGVEDEDLYLAGAALTVEAERRERGYAALERLGALVAATDGDLDDRVFALPPPRFAAAAAALFELGWVERATAA